LFEFSGTHKFPKAQNPYRFSGNFRITGTGIIASFSQMSRYCCSDKPTQQTNKQTTLQSPELHFLAVTIQLEIVFLKNNK
jgi:hypothetical protein